MSDVGLLRFSEYSYLQESVEEEYLYFNTIDSFKVRESKKTFHFRNDFYENFDEIIQPRDIKIFKFADREFQIDKDGNAIGITYGGYDYFTHVCCFNIVKIDEQREYKEGDSIFDKRLFEFGNSFLFIPISYIPDLLDGINRLCTTDKINMFKYGKIIYENIGEYSGEWGPLRKSDQYKYQNEFRILLQSKSTSPIKLKIPKLKEFMLGPTKEENTINRIIGRSAVLA